jgi:hypothetical protein
VKVFLLGVVLSAANGAAVRVETDAPQPDCPSVNALEAALQAQPELSQRIVESESTLFYGYGSPRAQGFRRLIVELRRKGGGVRLSRQLNIDERDCSVAQGTIALIVDRYFRDLAWTDANGSSLAASGQVMNLSPSSLSRRRRWASWLWAGVGYRYDDLGRFPSFAGIEIRHAAGLNLSLDAFLPAYRRDSVIDVGFVSSSTWSATIGIGARLLDAARLRVSVLPAATIGFEHATRSQDLHAAEAGWRSTLAGGGRLVASTKIASRFEVALAVEAFRSLWAPRFTVASFEVLRLPAWQALVTARLGFALAP